MWKRDNEAEAESNEGSDSNSNDINTTSTITDALLLDDKSENTPNCYGSNEEIGNNFNTSSPCSSSHEKKETSATYVGLILHNRPYRLFLMSYIISNIGDWLTYVSSIELIERILIMSSGDDKESTEEENNKKYISYLVLFRLLPYLILSPLGGVIADAHDRRKSMVILDSIASFLPFIFLLAVYCSSIKLVFLATFLQSSRAAMVSYLQLFISFYIVILCSTAHTIHHHYSLCTYIV